MANTYAVTPNVIPGNVTVGGDLTVQGNTIRLGSVSPFVRVQKENAKAALTYNLDRIAVAQDAGATRSGAVELWPGAITGRFDFFRQAAGAPAADLPTFNFGDGSPSFVGGYLAGFTGTFELGRYASRAKAVAAADNFGSVVNFHLERGAAPSSVTLTPDGGFPVNCAESVLGLAADGFTINMAATVAGDMQARGNYQTVGN